MSLKKLRTTHVPRNSLFKNVLGFTLIELMVVVAIIGLLASVAIPQYRKYQAKSRASEAKLALASVYTALESYFAEYNHYFSCISFAGYIPTGATADRYYSVGFSSATATSHAGTPISCTSAPGSTFYYQGIKSPGVPGTFDSNDLAIGTTLAFVFLWNTYTAQALGGIDRDFTTAANSDRWWINEQKQLVQTVVGY